MTEPTDAELIALLGDRQFSTIGAVREALRRWGTPPVVKWAPEEIADCERGIRWVTNEGIHGRPTDHDVREYLKRTPTAHGCHCDECKQFYTTTQPTQAQDGAVLTDREIELIDGMIQVQLDHASRCDAIANRSMADKQKGWDMERVALLQKIKAHGIKGGQHDTM